MAENNNILDSTCVSGEVLKKLPIGKFVAMVRIDEQIFIQWNCIGLNRQPICFDRYFNVLTGEERQ